MEQLTKLESINVWAGSLGVMACDETGNPIMEESKSWATLTPEFFQQLSTEDKDKINTIVNNKTNN
jgi:hypothetical protein